MVPLAAQSTGKEMLLFSCYRNNIVENYYFDHCTQQPVDTYFNKRTENTHRHSSSQNIFSYSHVEKAEALQPLFSSLKVHECLCVMSFMGGFMGVL